MGFGAECSSIDSWWWKWEIDPISPTVRERRFSSLGPKMTIHAATMMITRTTGINSSTYLPCGENPNHRQFRGGGWSGNDSADRDHMVWPQRPSPCCVGTLPTPAGPATQLVRNGPGDSG